jgi:hypothetical protein
MAAADVSDGDGAMLEADGSAAADELLDVPAEPPQAVRLSRAAAATPATVKVERLKDCISILLSCADERDRREYGVLRRSFPTVGHRPGCGTAGAVSHWVFAWSAAADG